METPTADEQLAEIVRLLDQRAFEEGRPVVDRIHALLEAENRWSDVACHHLHEIHRLKGEECDMCPYYHQFDGSQYGK